MIELNLRSLIQPSETLSIELTRTHRAFSNMIEKLTQLFFFLIKNFVFIIYLLLLFLRSF